MEPKSMYAPSQGAIQPDHLRLSTILNNASSSSSSSTSRLARDAFMKEQMKEFDAWFTKNSEPTEPEKEPKSESTDPLGIQNPTENSMENSTPTAPEETWEAQKKRWARGNKMPPVPKSYPCKLAWRTRPVGEPEVPGVMAQTIEFIKFAQILWNIHDSQPDDLNRMISHNLVKRDNMELVVYMRGTWAMIHAYQWHPQFGDIFESFETRLWRMPTSWGLGYDTEQGNVRRSTHVEEISIPTPVTPSTR